MKKIDHIAIAVKNLDSSKELFSKIFNKNPDKTEYLQDQKVNVCFYNIDNTKIELVESSNKSSVISKFIAKKGEGLHHVSFEVSDLESEKQRLQKLGFEILETSSKGANKTKVCFLHPKDTNGVLIELCEINHK